MDLFSMWNSLRYVSFCGLSQSRGESLLMAQKMNEEVLAVRNQLNHIQTSSVATGQEEPAGS